MKNRLLFLAGLILSLSAQASTIAIVDSGTDYRHQKLFNQYIKLPSGSGISGYAQDVYGWNFAERNNQVIDYKYLGTFSPDVPKFFEVQDRLLEGKGTQEDKDWMKSKRGDDKFIKELQKYGNFAHGTHVAGITALRFPENKVFAAKIIPTEVKLPFGKFLQNDSMLTSEAAPMDLKSLLFGFGLELLAKQQAKLLVTVGKYVDGRHADVANGSFGTGYPQAKTIVEMLYKFVFKEGQRKPEQVEEFTKVFLNAEIAASRGFVQAAPNTLFVFAAGNDGSNNDEFPCSPANIKEDNVITVAATMKNKQIASFSNYGTKMVDVAAPGVGIVSTVPGDDMGMMSGTSQAAPYVTGVAGEIKNQNPELTPGQIKQILIGTVDAKDWLKEKVKSGGFVNPERAFEAARLTKSMDIYSAIAASLARVGDMEVDSMNDQEATEAANSQAESFVQPVPSDMY